MATPHATLTHLAQQAAAQIGFTVRRWWRDKTDSSVLRVEVERRLVGARPAIAELAVAIPFLPPPRPPTPASTPTPPRTRPTTRPTRRAAGTRRSHGNPQQTVATEAAVVALPNQARTRVSGRKAGEARAKVSRPKEPRSVLPLCI